MAASDVAWQNLERRIGLKRFTVIANWRDTRGKNGDTTIFRQWAAQETTKAAAADESVKMALKRGKSRVRASSGGFFRVRNGEIDQRILRF